MMSLFSYFSSNIYICPFEHLAHALSSTAHFSLVIESWVQITHTSWFHNNVLELGSHLPLEANCFHMYPPSFKRLLYSQPWTPDHKVTLLHKGGALLKKHLDTWLGFWDMSVVLRRMARDIQCWEWVCFPVPVFALCSSPQNFRVSWMNYKRPPII